MSAVNPWEVLRALRSRELVAATVDDEPMSGCDAVDELVVIREQLDAALVHAPSPWGEPISVYTRADAIDDGTLLDVTAEAQTFAPGRFESVAMTAGADQVWLCDGAPERLAAVRAAMLALAATSGERADFEHDGHSAYVLAHEGDDGEQCATIMLAGED